jgi:hypothetical protein
MLAQTTKSFNIFLATETQQNHDNRRLLLSILIDSGRGGRQGRCLVLPLYQDATLEDEMDKAINYVLGFTPVPQRDLEVNLIHNFSGSLHLPPGHTSVNLVQVSPVQNPALQPLKNFIRNLPPMM